LAPSQLNSPKLGNLDLSRRHQILLNLEILEDEVLPLGRVLAHVEREQLIRVMQVSEREGIEAKSFAAEILYLTRRVATNANCGMAHRPTLDRTITPRSDRSVRGDLADRASRLSAEFRPQ
jgi:hypothetical protein